MENRMLYYFNVLTERSASLHSGTIVREGDIVQFTNSDGDICRDEIRRRDNGTLYFFNSSFQIQDYQNAIKDTNGKQERID